MIFKYKEYYSLTGEEKMKNNEKESQGSSQGLIEELFEEYVGSSKFLISLGVLLLGMGSCSYLYMAGRASLQESTPH